MIGILIVAHGRFAQVLLETAEMIVGRCENVHACSFTHGTDADDLRKMLKTAIRDADNGQGVIILTDMFGGTPSNISLSFLEGANLEVVTGVNLPMLLTALTKRSGVSLGDLAAKLKASGCSNIYIASEVLATKLGGK